MSDEHASYAGLRVAAFESRRAAEMARLIERLGGVPYVSPSMREIPLQENPAAIEFANRLITGQIDIVIFTTGAGFRHLLTAVERVVDRQRFIDALADSTTIVRGPKPATAMAEIGISPTYRVPEPNTWREVLTTIDANLSIANQRVGLQEYGQTNPSLIAGLEARGADVIRLRIYDWGFPLDTGPLEENVRRLARSQLDVVLFTSGHQVVNLLSMADRLGMADAVRDGLRRVVVASIGPTTSEVLRGSDIPVDMEPTHSKMGHLVNQSAARSRELVERKRRLSAAFGPPPTGQPAQASPHLQLRPMAVPSAEPGQVPPCADSRFMRACRLQPCDTTPVWLMRQAGRYLPEYRTIRAKVPFLHLCKDPALCAEIMIKTVQRLGVDAAIIFSDLLPILEPMGLELEYAQGEGPVIHNPVRDASDVDRVLELESAESLDFVMQTVRQTREGLPDQIPVIGFAGAPFTLASYTIEGGSSRSYLHTKTLMLRDEGAWSSLMQRLSRAVTVYLNAQIAAGAQCVQLFDSWAGCLGPDDYRRYVLPHVRQVISGIVPGVPVINFLTGNPALLACQADGGSAVVGVDWRVRLDTAWQTVGYDKALQGNLDPTALLADIDHVRARVREILQQAAGRPGHIFNLGHGVLPQTPVDNVRALVDAVHDLDAPS